MPAPAQLNPVPDDVAADNTTDVVVQVSCPPVALAPGLVLSSSTRAVAVLVQPFEPVTVTVYVPAELTVGFAVVLPLTMPDPDQRNVPPPAAERTTDVVVQVNVPPVALAPGGVTLLFTQASAVLVQPLAEFVTVTV